MLKTLLSDIKLFSILSLVCLGLILIDNLRILNFPKSVLQLITNPIQYGIYQSYLGVERQFEFIALGRKASQEYRALTEQIAQILSENANLRRKLAETEGFLNQQNSLSPQTYRMIPARPIGISRYLFIDKGSNDNLKPNQTVVYKDNYIGKIKEVSSNKSQVLLSTDPDSQISAFVQNKDGKAKGILIGQFGSSMKLQKVLHQEPLAEGDLVYSEGTEIQIPRGLILGQVSKVLENQTDIFKEANVKPVFDVTNLDILFIITD